MGRQPKSTNEVPTKKCTTLKGEKKGRGEVRIRVWIRFRVIVRVS